MYFDIASYFDEVPNDCATPVKADTFDDTRSARTAGLRPPAINISVRFGEIEREIQIFFFSRKGITPRLARRPRKEKKGNANAAKAGALLAPGAPLSEISRSRAARYIGGPRSARRARVVKIYLTFGEHAEVDRLAPAVLGRMQAAVD